MILYTYAHNTYLYQTFGVGKHCSGEVYKVGMPVYT